MLRACLVICAGMLAVPQMPAADSSIYVPVSYSTITPVNTKTLLPGTVISAGGAYTFVLSADGNTFFTIESRSPGSVVAIDRATGKPLHSYHTRFPISSGLAVLPNGSQIYVGTCPANNFVCQGYVEVFDVASGAHLAVIEMGGDQLSQIVAAPDSATVYAGHYYSCMQPCNGPRVPAPADSVPSDALTAIDVATLQPGTSYAYEDFGPMAVAIGPDSQQGCAWPGVVFRRRRALLGRSGNGHNRGDLGRVLRSRVLGGVAQRRDTGYGAELPVSGGHHVLRYFDWDSHAERAECEGRNHFARCGGPRVCRLRGRPGRRERSDRQRLPRAGWAGPG